ncbi:MAG TPA: prolyl oligopeptidase family serine peptidase, partial [Candidatus Dormibacteraeota bacterium]|nr:prolyl oligopeptidase family serine peptidase [Candidatus Dormibacteraeota bacterium]
WSFPLLAARGYVIFIADSAMRRGTPMHDVADTVLPGVNKLVAMGIADPKRLGVFGWSWGGYSTLSLIAQTDRFKAAVAGSGISNLLTFYAALHSDGTDWTGFGESNQGHIGGTPWQYRQRYVESSPFFYLDRVRTPVLLEYGDADTTVDPFNSRETFVALRRLGKIATLVDYTGEGHVLSKLSNQIDFSKRMIDWFDKYLKADVEKGNVAEKTSAANYDKKCASEAGAVKK